MNKILRHIACLMSLLLLSEVALAANPATKTFGTSVDEVFKAAKKAAAGHRILIPQDEGLKNLTDSGEEIKSFQFAASLLGVTFRVIEEISIEPLPDGTTKLELFVHRDRGSMPYVPSDSLKLRRLQLQNQLERELSQLEQLRDSYRTQYEVIHSIDLETYVNKKIEISRREHDLKIEEIDQETAAKIADLAGMPTSSFSTMDAAADKFFGVVQQNLHGKARGTAGVNQ
jgi:hypothetical protein